MSWAQGSIPEIWKPANRNEERDKKNEKGS